MACDVSVQVEENEAIKENSYNYQASLTPVITGVNPKRGGTGGGTRLTISGSGFGYGFNIFLLMHFSFQ